MAETNPSNSFRETIEAEPPHAGMGSVSVPKMDDTEWELRPLRVRLFGRLLSGPWAEVGLRKPSRLPKPRAVYLIHWIFEFKPSVMALVIGQRHQLSKMLSRPLRVLASR